VTAKQGSRAVSRANPSPAAEGAGLLARRVAVAAVDGVLRRRRPLDATLHADTRVTALEARDIAFAHALARLTMRRFGQISVALDARLARGLPRRAGALEAVLATGVAQLLFMDVADHAAVDLAVRLAHEDREADRYAGLVNAVLRSIARDSKPEIDAAANLPDWLGDRWAATYGEATMRAMAEAMLSEPPLDVTAKSDAPRWARTLGGTLLPTGTIRLTGPRGAVPELPGFTQGAWWVQDAAALLPVAVLGGVRGKTVLDLCAAPGGKTAALAARGAKVTAVDRAPERMARLAQNLDRLKLTAETLVRDVFDLDLDRQFDAVILDAPCTATGTLRRHPDVAWIKQPDDVAALAALQTKLLRRAVRFVAPGGTLVYSTCSLEPEEGEEQIARLLAAEPAFRLVPIPAADIGGLDGLETPAGHLRSRPDMLSGLGGIDGFFVARLCRAG
jgi:16S rRNA (cytosine967-C5)-methyltransferase